MKRRETKFHAESSDGEIKGRAGKGWWQLIGTGKERSVCMNRISKHRASMIMKILKMTR